MGAHADILRSLLAELNRFDRKVEALIVLQHERVAATRAHVESTVQMTRRYARQAARSPEKQGLLWD